MDDEPEAVAVTGGFAEGLGALPEAIVFGDGAEPELADEPARGTGMPERALEELAGVQRHGFATDQRGLRPGSLDHALALEGPGPDRSGIERTRGKPGEVARSAELSSGGVPRKLGVLADGVDAEEAKLPEGGLGKRQQRGGAISQKGG
ncbi:MAG: hypothetical protein HOH95_01105, partial [Dehalococcoidia bacterium]|nr:hypothetical protein [Dehalococcoidia bacterium]